MAVTVVYICRGTLVPEVGKHKVNSDGWRMEGGMANLGRYGPEKFLALGALAHAVVDQIPSLSYPIKDYNQLVEATRSLDFSLRVPGDRRISAPALLSRLPYIHRLVGDAYFPITDADDLIHKAGLTLISLVVRDHAPYPFGRIRPDGLSGAGAQDRGQVERKK
jgi:hypothetical protein